MRKGSEQRLDFSCCGCEESFVNRASDQILAVAPTIVQTYWCVADGGYVAAIVTVI